MAPRAIDLTGTWQGTLPFRIPDEDWTRATLSLTQTGTSLTGDALSRNGARYPLMGDVRPHEARLSLGGLPGTSTCASIELLVTGFETSGSRTVVDRISGQAMGRCYGTVAGSFVLERLR